MNLKFGGHDRGEVEVFAVGTASKRFLFVEINGWACNAGPRGENLLLLLRVARCIERHFGTRANETHVTNQDVYELGQFIKFRFAEPAPEGGNPRIAGGGD